MSVRLTAIAISSDLPVLVSCYYGVLLAIVNGLAPAFHPVLGRWCSPGRALRYFASVMVMSSACGAFALGKPSAQFCT